MIDGIDEIGMPGPGTQMLSIGAGLTRGDEAPVATDPRKEYVAVAPSGVGGAELPPEEYDRGAYGWHSLREYEWMLESPAAGSSFNALRAAVLAPGIALLPAAKPPVGAGMDGDPDFEAAKVEAAMAAQIADNNRRTVDAMLTPLNLVLWEGMLSMPFGHALGEPVYDYVAGGPDKGLVTTAAFKWKPRRNYRFVVDHAMNVRRVNALALADDGRSLAWRSFDADDFLWLTWDPYCGDPRGRSMFRMARHAWKMLMELWPEIMKGWKQFGTPWTWGTTAQGAKMVPATDASSGQPIPGKSPVTAEFAMALAMQKMKNGDAAAGPFGSDVKVVESAKDATVVSGAIDVLKNEIIQAILLQTRATVEAKHGSRADSETGQDIMGTLVRFVRIWLERFVRRLLMRQNAMNYGEDIARRLTPLVDLGSSEHQDFAAMASGVGVLWQASYFRPSQLPALDTMLGLPQGQADEPHIGPNGLIQADPNATTPATDPSIDQAPSTAPAEAVAA